MILRTCTVCGTRHDVEGWLALPWVGIQADDVESLELRNCACGSTLAVVVSERAPESYAARRLNGVWYVGQTDGGGQ